MSYTVFIYFCYYVSHQVSHILPTKPYYNITYIPVAIINSQQQNKSIFVYFSIQIRAICSCSFYHQKLSFSFAMFVTYQFSKNMTPVLTVSILSNIKQFLAIYCFHILFSVFVKENVYRFHRNVVSEWNLL